MQPYMKPTSTVPLPGNLTLIQFLQTVFVGITGLPGDLVRPAWQVEPPKQPDLPVNWMSIGIARATPDTYGFLGENGNGVGANSTRQETLEVACSIYGPNALETYGLIRDGFQIPANIEALTLAFMGYTEISEALHVPDLVFERFINRVTTSVYLRREIQRTYPVLSIASANGTIYVPDITEEFQLTWSVQQ